MGLVDAFTSDGTIELKYTEFYKLVRNSVTAEIMKNAVEADVPNEYIRGMLNGKKYEKTEDEPNE